MHTVCHNTWNRLTTFHHANTRGSRVGRLRIAHRCVLKQLSSHVSCLIPCRTWRWPQAQVLLLTSPIFPTVWPTHTRSLVHDPYLSCDVPRQSGRSTQIPSLTGYEPKAIETEAIETEAIEPEDLGPRRIELDRNLGTYIRTKHTKELWGNKFQNPITEDMDEFGKVGAETSYLQSQMHSDCDSAESIADSDLEARELRKMLAFTPV